MKIRKREFAKIRKLPNHESATTRIYKNTAILQLLNYENTKARIYETTKIRKYENYKNIKIRKREFA